MPVTPSVRSVITLLLLAAPAAAAPQRPHHEHGHVLDPERFSTDRSSSVRLPLPEEVDAFSFAIFGDRTGGPPEGVRVLAQAVDDVNLLGPDLVMTVGDLVQGYNAREQWLEQMREFKGIMDRLAMPWFPVAGNHDIYWRGEGKPPGEHEGDYEAWFGPLWYAFWHKRSCFIVLYSDEGNPETGEKSISDHAAQVMSPAQLAWLEATLQRAKDAEHVFCFLHHPRWLTARYGDDWSRVHRVLVRAGNVSAVFAGHIHLMRYDGVRDGIEYFTLATTGGDQRGDLPQAGYLHHYHLVTVRRDHVDVAAVPVGTVIDPRKVTGELVAEARAAVNRLSAEFGPPLAIDADGRARGHLEVSFHNPVSRPLELTVAWHARDGRWDAFPDHRHVVLAPDERAVLAFRVDRLAGPIDAAFALPELRVSADYLAEGLRIALPSRTHEVPVRPPALLRSAGAVGALRLDGRRDYLRVDDAALRLPDGAFTVEGWLRADRFERRQGFVNKTEDSEFGLFVDGGAPAFLVHLGGGYVAAKAAEPCLRTGTWHHVAGVFDGAELRLYVDGALVSTARGAGSRTRNGLPLIIGGDVDGDGRGTSLFPGVIDEVRVSRVARYSGDRFDPARRFAVDAEAALLLHLDAAVGPWLPDASGGGAHAVRAGAPRVTAVEGGTTWFGR